MARPKGFKNHKWTDDERIKFVHMYEEGRMTLNEIQNEYGVPRGTLRGWLRRYRTGGLEALNPKQLHPGNHFSALHTSKSLSKEDRLTLIIEKLQIENERLKKGYITKGVVANKEFVTLKDLNSK